MRNQCQSFDNRLGYKNSVEWISMVLRQFRDRKRVFEVNLQWLRPELTQAIFKQQGQLGKGNLNSAGCLLDCEFPKAGNTYMYLFSL